MFLVWMRRLRQEKKQQNSDDMKVILRYIVCLLASLSLMVQFASAQDISRQQDRKNQLEKEIVILDKQIADIRQQSSSATSHLELLRQNISARKSLVEESNRVIRTYTDSISRMNRNIEKLQAEVDTLVSYHGKLIRNAYKYRDPHVWYLYVFASENLGQAFRRAGYFRSISDRIRSDAELIRGKKAEVEARRAALDLLKKDAVALKAERVRELETLKADEKEAENLVAQLKRERSKCESQVTQKRKEVKALNREIQRLIDEAMKPKSGKKISKEDLAAATALAGEFEANTGKFPWPVNGVLVGSFGKKYHPVFKQLELPSNEGIDIAVQKDEPVNCIFNGKVVDVFIMPAYGQCVLVQHGSSYFTFYCRIGSLDVKKGDSVKTGQRIGLVEELNGTTQLHFEIWKGKVPQDPSKWLRKK